MRLPEGAQEGYHKNLEAYTLVFEFDEEGRLVLLRGRGGVTLLLEPAVEGSEAPKKVTARQLEADFDPVSGELRDAVCESAVTFEQGEIRATGEKGTFRNAESLLVLEQGPRLWDGKASLEANVIHVGVVSGDVAGMGSVRSTSNEPGGAAGKRALFPSDSQEAVYFLSDEMRFDRARDTAVYTGSARGLSGPNRIEAERIEIRQGAGVISASGNVETAFVQKVGKEAAEATVTQAETFLYRSDEGKLQYDGRVAMRSGSLTLKGRGVEVMLEAEGQEVSEIVAEGRVAIETENGTASGDTARYLPKEESMTVQGETARLENAGKLTEGKHLTFFLGSDKIFVDGREQARTKTTYSSKPRF